MRSQNEGLVNALSHYCGVADPFFYLYEGSQCYSFVSQDGTLVLKLLKQGKFFSKKNSKKFKKRKRANFLNSCHIAAERLKRESGLLYLHFSIGQDSEYPISVVDQEGKQHMVDLNQVEFVMQRYANLVIHEIACAMNQHDETRAKRIIDQVFLFFQHRMEKGVLDRDPSILTNLSLGERDEVIQIDIGKFYLGRPNLRDLLLIRQKNEQGFELWLRQKHPSLLSYYLERLDQFESFMTPRVAPNRSVLEVFSEKLFY